MKELKSKKSQNEIVGNHKHLTFEDREYIQEALTGLNTFKSIAEHLQKDPTCISREVKHHRIFREASFYNNKSRNQCIHKRICSKTNLCPGCASYKLCQSCTNCNLRCPDFEKEICMKLFKAPYVCNGCNQRQHCQKEKYYYRAKQAQDSYRMTLVDSRKGINLTEEELVSVDEIISPLLKKGQSLAHIYASHINEMPCSRRSLYSLIQDGFLSCINLDLPRKVRYKKRRKKKSIKPPKAYREGRSYEDFQKHASDNLTSVVEMDLVEGRQGGKVLLTMLFRSSKLMLCYLLEKGSQLEVLRVFDELTNGLGLDGFRGLFPIILTDNGPEFMAPENLEKNVHGQTRTKIFYCDPYSSWQKGTLEKNHQFIRYVLPKGKSFDNLTQEDVFLLRDHINCIAREQLNGKSPLEIASLLTPASVLKKLNLRRITPDNICLKPSLLKR
jgi:IS30 family transposase